MTNDQAAVIAFALFFGLVLNGIFSKPSIRVDTYSFERATRELSEGMEKAACHHAGRYYQYGECKDTRD